MSDRTQTIGVYILDPTGKMLVVHPTETGDRWGIPKGRPDEGELSKMTAIREVWEETGIDLLSSAGKMGHVGEEKYTNKYKKLIAYTIQLDEVYDKKLYCKSLFRSRISGEMIPEVDDYKWVRFNDYKHKIQTEQVRLWERYVKHKP